MRQDGTVIAVEATWTLIALARPVFPNAVARSHGADRKYQLEASVAQWRVNRCSASTAMQAAFERAFRAADLALCRWSVPGVRLPLWLLPEARIRRPDPADGPAGFADNAGQRGRSPDLIMDAGTAAALFEHARVTRAELEQRCGESPAACREAKRAPHLRPGLPRTGAGLLGGNRNAPANGFSARRACPAGAQTVAACRVRRPGEIRARHRQARHHAACASGAFVCGAGPTNPFLCNHFGGGGTGPVSAMPTSGPVRSPTRSPSPRPTRKDREALIASISAAGLDAIPRGPTPWPAGTPRAPLPGAVEGRCKDRNSSRPCTCRGHAFV